MYRKQLVEVEEIPLVYISNDLNDINYMLKSDERIDDDEVIQQVWYSL